MGKGYAEGPAAEERYAALERGEGFDSAASSPRIAGRLCSARRATSRKHFLGWADEVDPDDLFASGKAWGLKVVVRRDA